MGCCLVELRKKRKVMSNENGEYEYLMVNVEFKESDLGFVCGVQL